MIHLLRSPSPLEILYLGVRIKFSVGIQADKISKTITIIFPVALNCRNIFMNNIMYRIQSKKLARCNLSFKLYVLISQNIQQENSYSDSNFLFSVGTITCSCLSFIYGHGPIIFAYMVNIIKITMKIVIRALPWHRASPKPNGHTTRLGWIPSGPLIIPLFCCGLSISRHM